MKKWLPVACALILGVASFFVALRRTDLTCDRTTCVYNDEHSFPTASVREVRFVEGLGKNRRNAESQLVFASGHELRLGYDDTDSARETHRTLKAFFAGETDALHFSSKGSPWFFAIAAACAIAAVVFGVRAYKTPGVYKPPGEKQPFWSGKRKRYIVIGAGALVAIVGIQLAISTIASRVQGTLQLECQQRCRFDGMECLPGGSMQMTLDEGTYQIEVWARSGSALWLPQTFQIVTGETTRFVCR
jgi:hypothetical protein